MKEQLEKCVSLFDSGNITLAYLAAISTNVLKELIELKMKHGIFNSIPDKENCYLKITDGNSKGQSILIFNSIHRKDLIMIEQEYNILFNSQRYFKSKDQYRLVQYEKVDDFSVIFSPQKDKIDTENIDFLALDPNFSMKQFFINYCYDYLMATLNPNYVRQTNNT